MSIFIVIFLYFVEIPLEGRKKLITKTRNIKSTKLYYLFLFRVFAWPDKYRKI
jgi:hypothetical protein